MYYMTIETFRDNIEKAIKKVNKEEKPIFIGEKDKEPDAVLVSLEEYEDMLDTIRILSDKELSDIIFDRVEVESISWEDAMKELALEDIEEEELETFESLKLLMKDLNDEDNENKKE